MESPTYHFRIVHCYYHRYVLKQVNQTQWWWWWRWWWWWWWWWNMCKYKPTAKNNACSNCREWNKYRPSAYPEFTELFGKFPKSQVDHQISKILGKFLRSRCFKRRRVESL